MTKKDYFHKKLIPEIDKKYIWTGNILRRIAEEMEKYPVKDEEIEKINRTKEFFKEIEREIMNREISIIQINAKPRMAKSTTGIVLGMYMFKLLQKYFPKEAPRGDFGLNNIARDEQERIKKMRDPSLMFNIIVTDESNALEQTGENATTEQAQRVVFSDVQAGRYIHSINICPAGIMDNNTDIMLEIRNRQEGLVHCKLYYNLPKTTGSWDWIFLGMVDIDVSIVLENWKGNKVEELFYKELKEQTETGQADLKKYAEKDFYVKYMIRKYQKMDIMNKYGILRSRDLDYAEVINNVVEKTKGLVKILPMTKIRTTIRNYVESEFRKNKIPVSMIGVNNTLERVEGLLNLHRTFEDIINAQNRLEYNLSKGKVKSGEYKYQKEELEKQKKEIVGLMKEQEDELKRNIEINKEYNEMIKE